MKLSEYLNSSNFSNKLSEICDLLSSEKATATITYLGARIITVSGFEGSVTIDEIGRQVLRNQPDGINTIKIIDSLKGFYQITDTKLENSSWITKLFGKIRDFSLFDKPVRIQLDFVKEYIKFS